MRWNRKSGIEILNVLEQYKPHIIGEFNDCYLKAIKVKGEFIWHHHDEENELFLVVKGTLRMKFRVHEAVIGAGEFIYCAAQGGAFAHRRRRGSGGVDRAEIDFEHRKCYQ